LIAAIGVILVVGIVMLSSATTAYAYSRYQDSYYFFKRQLFGLGLSLVVFYFLSNIDYRLWKKYAFLMLVISIVLLLLVFIPGLSANYGKARSWINVFGFSLQPSELVKISFLLYLSAWLESRKGRLKDVGEGTGPFLAVLGIISLLMLLQPDFGTLSIIAFSSLVIYYVGGGSKRHMAVIIIMAVLALVIMIKIKPYQADRFRCFNDPNYSANDVCYQVNQSLIAVGSGGFWGRGLGQSRQKFMYLPEVSGDSIFPIIAEEAGLVFSSLLVMLYFFLFYRGCRIAKNAPDDFGRILSIGIVTWLAFQALVNVGGMVNLIPMTGVPLPFVSYGGSAMISALGAVGILVNISKQTKYN